MIIKAFAKINLTLDIVGLRPDGFHELRSVMVPVSLCDEIELTPSEELSFDCNIASLMTEDNLCIRAVKKFFERSGIDSSVSIKLTKNIPFPAGLGGGSADAAAVLKGLNQIFGSPLDEATLFELASSLGSDVSVCLLGKSALCEGRGEILTPLENIGELNVVIAIGNARLSTPAVYREYDSSGLKPRNDTDLFLKSLSSGDKEKLIASFGNAFEPVTDILAPETMKIRDLMLSLGAISSHLSGSGPSVYGIFKDKESASLASENLKQNGYSAYQCVTM